MTEPIDFSYLSGEDLDERAVSLGLPPGAFTARKVAGIARRIDNSGGADACWRWLGAQQGSGYGICSLGGTSRGAHRVVHVLANGPLADRRHQVRHDCDHAWCVNPRHLRPGTAKDNAADALARGRHRAGPVLTDAERDLIPRLAERLARSERRRGRPITRTRLFARVADIFEISAARAGTICDEARRRATPAEGTDPDPSPKAVQAPVGSDSMVVVADERSA